MSNTRRNDFKRLEKRRSEAAERISARLSRSSKQQLEKLNGRLGVNVGAKKERNRLTTGED